MSQLQPIQPVHNPYANVSNSDYEWPAHIFDPNDARIIGARAYLSAAAERVEVGVYYAAKDRLNRTRDEIEASRRMKWRNRLGQIMNTMGDARRAFHGRTWMV
ncbi:hypothetical protein AC578_9343 [Pseudocercospora eumusae]|uniref:Uncharacterized protein n=1 Tax=Pseudocercospora eumusae TaxID=321146 RepID=A0A139GUA9_9PEZI|nr:hypothetical protein AC578_9343 [Pseudocercospora eumusae]